MIWFCASTDGSVSGTGSEPSSGRGRRRRRRPSVAAALAESEARLRLVLETSNLAIWDWRRGGDGCYLSPRFYTMLGYEPGELPADPALWLAMVHPDDLKTAAAAFADHLSGSRNGHCLLEFRIRSKSGEWRWMLGHAQVVERDADGVWTRVVGSHSDITDLRRVELDRDRLFDLSIDMLCVAGFDGFLKQINPAWTRVLGWSKEELLARPWLDFVHPDDVEATLAAGAQLRANSPVACFENRYRCKDGAYRWLSWNSFPLPDDELIFAVIRDTTESKAAEERLQQIVDTAPFGTHMYELTDDGRLVFLGANAAADRILGVDCRTFVGKDILEAFPALAKTDVPAAYRRAAEVGERYETEQVDYDENGIRGAYYVVAFQTAPRKMAAFFQDITERKRSELAQREFEKRIEAQKRQFYRETIYSVTEGKLDICEFTDVKTHMKSAGLVLRVDSAANVSGARRQAESFCRDSGLDGDGLEAFALGVGEALTNAIKHATGGSLFVGRAGNSVWAAVMDRGPGIESLILPKAVLKRGYSTKPSLGLGYSIMLEIADRVMLYTGRRGTVVVLIKDLEAEEQELSVFGIPDTWDSPAVDVRSN